MNLISPLQVRMFDGFNAAGTSATITSNTPIIGSHTCAGTGPAAAANNDPASTPVVASYGTTDYYALTPAANVMIGIPSTTGAVASLTATPITVVCGGGISPLSQTVTPVVGAFTRTAYRPRDYNGFPCKVSTTSNNLLGAVATGDVRIPPTPSPDTHRRNCDHHRRHQTAHALID
jgi:hypothetical protein